MKPRPSHFAMVALTILVGSHVRADDLSDLLAGRFSWTASVPLIGPAPATDKSCAIKDPSVVWHEGRWHIFATIKTDRPANMEYLSFTDWDKADAAPRHVITLDETYHCAPQVFYFRPKKTWYLIYQWTDKSPKTPYFGPAFSTLSDVSRPETLTKPVMLFPTKPENVERWIDFWVICDETHAYLFFTGDDGRFWREPDDSGRFSRRLVPARTRHAGQDQRAVRGRPYLSFERAGDLPQSGRGDRPAGPAVLQGVSGRSARRPLAADRGLVGASFRVHPERPLRAGVEPWTDSISHGELLRDGIDETLTVDPAHLRFLFQGCSQKDRAGKSYGQFPWRLGILEPAGTGAR